MSLQDDPRHRYLADADRNHRALPVLERGEDVALVAHGHTLRILTSVWLRTEPRFGAQLELDAGAVSVLGYERHFPSIVRWNVPAPR